MNLSYLDLRYDEIIVFFCNKENIDNPDMKLNSDFNEKEYAEYLKNADYNALKNIEILSKYGLYRYRFRTSSSKDIVKYLSQSDTIINFWLDNKQACLLDSLDNLISNFKNEFQKTLSDTSKRKAFSIHFAENIPLTEIIKIIDISWKYGLIYEVDCIENRLNICTLRSND